jgi:hypothetical protein
MTDQKEIERLTLEIGSTVRKVQKFCLCLAAPAVRFAAYCLKYSKQKIYQEPKDDKN